MSCQHPVFQGACFSGLDDVRKEQIDKLLAQYTQLQIDGWPLLKWIQEQQQQGIY